MQARQLDILIKQAMDVTEAVKAEVRGLLMSEDFRTLLREIVRDELHDNAPSSSEREQCAFTLRSIRREIAALAARTKE